MEIRKTYVTKVPDTSGVFLLASRIIAGHGGNIVRVNYNHAVDSHTFFLEISAEEEQHEKIAKELLENGFMTTGYDATKVIMLDLKLPGRSGAMIAPLEVLDRHKVYITYVSSQDYGDPFQHVKLGVRVDGPEAARILIEELSQICETAVLDYEVTNRQLDNTVFYVSFANEMRDILSLSQEDVNCTLIRANKLMQVLDEQEKAPMQAFNYMLRFAKFVKDHKGPRFDAKISAMKIADDLVLNVIEPPCGSNTYVIRHEDRLLFVDGGYSCYYEEMLQFLGSLYEDFDSLKKTAFITHADMDHTGLSGIWDEVYMSGDSYENFLLESRGEPGFREQNLKHKPYFGLSEIIIGYKPPDTGKMRTVGYAEARQDGEMLTYIGKVDFGGYRFDFYQGPGGHVKGEVVIVCEALKLLFSGDIWVNVRAITPEQKEFNRLAPFLLTGVDEDPVLSRKCREYVVKKFGGYLFCPGHGPVQTVESRPR